MRALKPERRERTRVCTCAGDCESADSSRDCGREDCNREHGEAGASDGAPEQDRPGQAPKGTVHVVELHQQLKGVIEK